MRHDFRWPIQTKFAVVTARSKERRPFKTGLRSASRSTPKNSCPPQGLSSKEITGLYFVLPTSKVDQLFFINKILKPIVERNIPRLYPGEKQKVIPHFEPATIHTTPAMYEYLDDQNETYIWKEGWLSNSPDLSSIDYGPNGIFNDLMFWKKPKDFSGLQSSAGLMWKNFPLFSYYDFMKS